jgi:hypothetical protein
MKIKSESSSKITTIRSPAPKIKSKNSSKLLFSMKRRLLKKKKRWRKCEKE